MTKLFYVLFAAAVLIGCKSDDPTPVAADPTPVALKGVFIVNEGNLNSSNSTLSFYSFDSSKPYADVFSSANSRALGDNANDLANDNGKTYIVVNNSHKIEVISSETYKSLGTIFLPSKSPYKIAIYNDSKAFVTNFKQRSVSVINPTTFAVVKDSIPVGNDPTGILLTNNKIYVCNSGGLTPDSTVSVIDPVTNTVVTTIVVGLGPNEIALDSEGDILVLCTGSYNKVPSSVYSIRTDRDSVTNIMTIPMNTYGNIYKFAVSTKGYGLLPSYATIAKFDTKTNTITASAFINKSAYGIAIDNITENIYLGVPASDYVSNGNLFVYDKNAVKKDSVAVGINPGTIVFKR
ncbi:MAG: hypothetical protein M0R68_05075 [Bacteroidetes bacterium]|nr:hypothetical protein [Bacteroidota bacterium]